MYGIAREVIVWLEPNNWGQTSELAMDFLQRNFHLKKDPRTKDILLAELLAMSSEAEIRATAL